MTDQIEFRFDGSDYNHLLDNERLTGQLLRILTLMLDHEWRTLPEISEITGDGEASISAQLRNAKKERFGAFVLERRPRGDRAKGLFEYRIMPPGHVSEWVSTPRPNRFKEALNVVLKSPECPETLKEKVKKIIGKNNRN